MVLVDSSTSSSSSSSCSLANWCRVSRAKQNTKIHDLISKQVKPQGEPPTRCRSNSDERERELFNLAKMSSESIFLKACRLLQFTQDFIKSCIKKSSNSTTWRWPGILPIWGLKGDTQGSTKQDKFVILGYCLCSVFWSGHFHPSRSQKLSRFTIVPPDDVGDAWEGFDQGCFVHVLSAHVP
jgi:hypothetical protein